MEQYLAGSEHLRDEHLDFLSAGPQPHLRKRENWCRVFAIKQSWRDQMNHGNISPFKNCGKGTQSTKSKALCQKSSVLFVTLYNSSPPVNKPHTSPLTPKQVRFIQRKNVKITTRPSAVYDGQGISCNYRQSCIYIEIMRDEEINPETTNNSSSTSNIDVSFVQ